jgi:biopolymer transport protein ExbD
MARKRKRSEPVGAELEMTPMIDVVFQLLIYFSSRSSRST